MLAPEAIKRRYWDTSIHRESNGRKVLVNLPKRQKGEMEEIVRWLSSFGCRSCASCCNGGFGITGKDPNFEGIMRKIGERKKAFVVKKTSRQLGGTFDVFVPRGENACGFLFWVGGRIPVGTLGDPELQARGDPEFSCMIYGSRAAACTNYPFTRGWMLEKQKPLPNKRAVMVLEPQCKALLDLAEIGVGHLTHGEIIEIGDQGGKAMASSLLKALEETWDFFGAGEMHEQVFYTESSEVVYPLLYREVVPVFRRQEIEEGIGQEF